MFKKIITSALVVVWISSLALAGYRLFEPKAAEAIIENKVSLASVDAQGRSVDNGEPAQETFSSYSFDDSMEADVVEEDTYHYYYFCSEEDADCLYINQYVLKPLAETLEVEQIDILEYVDISTLPSEWTPLRMKNQWGFDDYPAFAAVLTTPAGERTILSVLQWDANNPMDTEALKNWMIENGIWTGPVEEQGELIDQPAG